MKKYLIGIGALTLLGGAYAVSNLGADVKTYTVISWEKPTTDAEWAEDVKRENFDIKSTGVLETMIASHTAKLERERKGVQKYLDMQAAGQDPVQHLYWEWRENLHQSYPEMSEQELTAESLKQAQEQYSREMWSVEKLQQSVERMNKEVELREKGFVVVEGEEVLLGGSHDPRYIRHIND